MPPLTDAIKHEIGQHFVFGFHGHEVSDDIKTLIRDYHLGSVILMKRNVRDAEQVRRIVRELQLLAKESGHEKPLLIGIDQENGLVSAFSSPTAGTQFPGAMAIAATGDSELAYEVSKATAQELKSVGINWAYSPVADVNSDPRNPVIGVRSFGDDPAVVGKYASAVARGLTASGVAPTAKHFPGHGDTHVDSHLALPIIPKSAEELRKTELVPFKELTGGSQPIASVMTGHMALPVLTGGDLPASLSSKVTTDLLRGELKYEGVIVTDCLEMEAVASTYGVPEGAVRSLEAGADVAMVCHRFDRHIGSLKSVYEAVESGRLSLDKLQKGGERIKRMKDAFAGSWDDVLGTGDDAAFGQRWTELKKTNLALSQRAYQKSCTVVWGGDLLPLRVGDDKEVVIFTPEMESLNAAVDDHEGQLRDPSGRLRNTAGPSYVFLAEQVGSKVRSRHIVYSARGSEQEVDVGGVGGVIFVLRNADQKEWQRECMRRVLSRYQGVPVVLLSSCGPYDLDGEDVSGAGRVYLRTYEFTAAAFEGFVGLIV